MINASMYISIVRHGVRGRVSILPGKQNRLDVLVGDIVFHRPDNPGCFRPNQHFGNRVPGAVKLALDFSLAVSLALQTQNVAVVDHSTPSSMKIVTQDMCAISIIEGGAPRRDGGAETPCRWCYFSVQVVLTRWNSHHVLIDLHTAHLRLSHPYNHSMSFA